MSVCAWVRSPIDLDFVLLHIGPFQLSSHLTWLLFIFQRHNTIEHGGRMSRSKRNAALQVCMIFNSSTS